MSIHGSEGPCQYISLALAEYILKRLTEDGYTTEKLSEEFDGNEKYVLSLLDFLKGIQWENFGIGSTVQIMTNY